MGHCLRDMIANKREEARTTSSKASSSAEEKIRSLALKNQKSIYPISMGVTPPTLAVQVAHPNIAMAARPAQAKRAATKKSPKSSPRRSKAVVAPSGANQSARVAHTGGNRPSLPPAVEVPHITSTFNNFDFMAVTKGSSQEMSLQQQKILQLLEGGFKGTVEDVIRAAQ